jgi:hypothetical protein
MVRVKERRERAQETASTSVNKVKGYNERPERGSKAGIEARSESTKDNQ